MPLRAGTALLAALAVGVASAAPAHAATGEPVATLSPGEHAFWDGPYTESAQVPASEFCGVAGPCWSYRLGVERGESSRLRVAIDWRTSSNEYALELRDPSGELVAAESHLLHFSLELFVPRPAPGTWTIRVIPKNVERSSFRARARLDPPAGAEPRRRALLPNLQVNAPWRLGFVAPAAPYTGRPADVLGFHPFSCWPDETAFGGAQRCLRFSVGPMNSGAGPYEARFDAGSARPNAEGQLEGPVIQRIYRGDGSHLDRSAGRFVFHERHGHFHVQDMLSYELLRVVDPARGRLEPTGEGRKASFCTLDLMIADFGRFESQPSRYTDEDVCFRPPNSDTTLVMGITPGWSDVYTWDLPDQYVEFGAGSPGYYVVRAVVDEPNTIRESREDDNAGYAYIQVAGDEVRLIERGIGTSPWDRSKTVLPDR
jgi:Lysyl oxidase